MSTRLKLALPIDTLKLFDATVTQTQITNNTPVGSSDDEETLTSYLEDAADEYRSRTTATMAVSRVGVADKRETFEELTHKLSGHQITKGTFTGTWTEYLPEQKAISMDNENILPFDSTLGDAVYVYQGLAESGSSWKDITTEEGDTWEILNHRDGLFTFSPIDIADEVLTGRPTARGVVPEFVQNMRFVISYRYGGLGGDRGRASSTELDEDITDSQTGTVDVTDGSGFPTGTEAGPITVLIGTEYLQVQPDPGNDQMDILTRGVRQTSTASHDDGDTVQYTPPTVRKAVAARAGMTLVQSGRYQAFLPDSEDAIDRGDLLDELRSTWEGTVGALS